MNISMAAMNPRNACLCAKAFNLQYQGNTFAHRNCKSQKMVTKWGTKGHRTCTTANKHGLIPKGSAVHTVKVWTNRPVWQGVLAQTNLKIYPKLGLGPVVGACKSNSLQFGHAFNWRGWWEYGTGALGDMGCHLTNIPFRVLNGILQQ